jgi:hypothetical protein
MGGYDGVEAGVRPLGGSSLGIEALRAVTLLGGPVSLRLAGVMAMLRGCGAGSLTCVGASHYFWSRVRPESAQTSPAFFVHSAT